MEARRKKQCKEVRETGGPLCVSLKSTNTYARVERRPQQNRLNKQRRRQNARPC